MNYLPETTLHSYCGSPDSSVMILPTETQAVPLHTHTQVLVIVINKPQITGGHGVNMCMTLNLNPHCSVQLLDQAQYVYY